MEPLKITTCLLDAKLFFHSLFHFIINCIIVLKIGHDINFTKYYKYYFHIVLSVTLDSGIKT